MNKLFNLRALTKMLCDLRAFVVKSLTINGELGGYVHDTAFSQFIPPTMLFGDTAAWAIAAGQVANSKVYGCDATDETANLYVPVLLPSNSVAGKGAYLKSIEIIYEIVTAACDSVTAVIHKTVVAVEGTGVTVTQPAFSQSPTAANSKTADQHRLVLTLTTPVWVDNDDAYHVAIAFDKAATSTVEVLGAIANFTLRA